MNFVQNNIGVFEPLVRADRFSLAGLEVNFNGSVGWDFDTVAYRIDVCMRDSFAVADLRFGVAV